MDDPSPFGGLVIGGRAAFYGPRPTAEAAARHAHALLAEAEKAEAEDNPTKLQTYWREAIESLVDAFLLDRIGQSEGFVEAHVVGRRVARRFGCPLTRDDKSTWGRECGVLALHNRLGLSVGGVTRGRCGLCGAPDFGCTHIPGQWYESQACIREVLEVDLREVSVVRFPDDPRCYRLFERYPNEVIEGAYGGPLPEDVLPACDHCLTCGAAENGPTVDDLDQGLWGQLSIGAAE